MISIHLTTKDVHKKVYESLASEYEARSGMFAQSIASTLDMFSPHIHGKRILEIGCGVGLITEELTKRGFSVSAIDFAQSMVTYAKRRNPDADIQTRDFMDFSANAKYNALIMSAFIHLYSDDEAGDILERAKNLFDIGGVLLINTTDSKTDESGWYEKGDYAGKPKRFRRYWTKKSFERFLVEQGFLILDFKEVTDSVGKVWLNYAVAPVDSPGK